MNEEDVNRHLCEAGDGGFGKLVHVGLGRSRERVFAPDPIGKSKQGLVGLPRVFEAEVPDKKGYFSVSIC